MTWTYPPDWTKDHARNAPTINGDPYPKVEKKREHISEWRSWYAARARCHRTEDKNWKNYGGRGIHMAAEWFMDFDAFLDYIGPKPTAYHTIDRIDNDRGYVPGNVRWATAQTQAANRRHPSRWTKPGGSEVDLTDLTPGQRRVAKAVATRMRASEEKKAEVLRERGWIVLPPEVAAAGAESKGIAEILRRNP